MKNTILAFSLALSFCAGGCDDPGTSASPGSAPAGEDVAGGGGSGFASSGGGGGDVSIGPESGGATSITDRYKNALGKIKQQDWDGARSELMEALNRSEGQPVEKEIREHLKLVEQGILAQPAYSPAEVFANAPNFIEKSVSMRGRFLQGGSVGKVTYYFWLENGKKVQCRYASLPLDEKKLILSMREGSIVLVRGVLQPPWGSSPNPYLDLSFFRLERAAPAAPKPAAQEGAP